MSGFYFNRFYPDWDETRLGGRITLGKQFTPEWSANVNLRLENVTINNPRETAASIAGGNPQSVPELEAVRGDNALAIAGFSVSHDTRDSSLLPTDGHFVTGTVDQAFGDFNYTRLEVDGRQYFTTYRGRTAVASMS